MPASVEIDLRHLAKGQVLSSVGADVPPELAACDREPIHVPGAIQPYGLLLIAGCDDLVVKAGAGDIEGRLTPRWLDRSLNELLAQDVGRALDGREGAAIVRLALVPGRTETFEALASVSGDDVLVSFEPVRALPLSAAEMLAELDNAGASFERATDLASLCTRAALIFRKLTGFDRVMIYRFLDDGAGLVVAEERAAGLSSFLNHHFPASDIPRQARALYVRNRVRVIPDIHYAPAPIRPEAQAMADLSDIGIRSVSPTHLHYLRNMGVGASASISIVKDGLLWGLVACHHQTPRGLDFDTRSICATLAGGLARQIRAKEEAEVYRERIRLRAAEDMILGQIEIDQPIGDLLSNLGTQLRGMLGADGFAALCDGDLVTGGIVPERGDLLALAHWLGPRAEIEPFVSRSLSTVFPAAAVWPDRASGVLAVSVAADTSMLLVWFRVEEPELVEWAGNPHKQSIADPGAILTPRNSFQSWREEVGFRARPWTLAQIEAAVRLRRRLFEARQARRLRELNRELGTTIADKERLIAQKDHLLREVNHRVQNSLQLVQSFLALQARGAGGETAANLIEAQRRISAVALVHRRLYQADQVDTVDLARYLEELVDEMRAAMGAEWAAALTLDLAPILLSADRAVHVGLILTELIINANKYAYGGGSGPISISLEEYRNRFRLIVADHGCGAAGDREGFGSRMMTAMVQRLDGEIERFDNQPGLRVIVTAPAGA